MDILNNLLTVIQNELGADIFTEEKREHFERQFRFEHGGSEHYIGSARAYETARRHKEVRRLAELGLKNPEIAERMGITRQQVWSIRQAG